MNEIADYSKVVSNLTENGGVFAIIGIILLIAVMIIGIVVFIKLLILTINEGLKGENQKLKTMFWLVISSFVVKFIPYGIFIAAPIGIANFVLLCMVAFGENNPKAKTIFKLQMIMIGASVAAAIFCASAIAQSFA